MAYNVDFGCSCVGNNCLSECSKILQILLGVHLIRSEVLIPRAPCSDVELGLLVAHTQEVLYALCKASELVHCAHCDV